MRDQLPESDRRTVLKGIGAAATLTITGSLEGTLTPSKISKEWEIKARRPSTTALVANPKLNTVEFGANNALHSLSTNGETAWETNLSTGTPTAAPTRAQGTVYVHSFNGIHAFDPKSGQKKWETTVNGAGGSRPVVHQGVLFVTRRFDIENDSPPALLALDAKTGEKQWTAGLHEESWTQPAVIQNRVVAADMSGMVVAYRTNDGSQEWSVDLDTPITGSIRANEGALYVTDQSGTLHKINPTDGSSHWTVHVGQPQTGSLPQVSGGTVYQSHKSGLAAINADTGEKKWTVDEGTIVSDTAIHKDTMYYGTLEHSITARDKKTGDEVWKLDIPPVAYSDVVFPGIRKRPVILKDAIYFGHDSGHIFALN